jgi:8-oxo-dGTP diphosphatase
MSTVPLGLKKAAVLILLKSADQFLLLLRDREPNQGLYTPVGGKLDPGERPLDAALRETREETGIHIQDPKFCGILTESSPGKYNWISYVYLAEIPWQPAPPCNEGTLAWIPVQELAQLPTPPTDLAIYQYALRVQPFVLDALFNESLELLEMKDELSGQTILPAS